MVKDSPKNWINNSITAFPNQNLKKKKKKKTPLTKLTRLSLNTTNQHDQGAGNLENLIACIHLLLLKQIAKINIIENLYLHPYNNQHNYNQYNQIR